MQPLRLGAYFVNDSLHPDCAADEAQLTSERKRVRELFKYFRAASQAVQFIDPDCHESYDPTLARLASDPALTAFAQLGALRLDCDRSFISLIDSHEQHIIAEASRSISLYKADHHRPGDALCLGATPLDLFAGVCAGTMKVFTSQDDRYHISTSNIFADYSRCVINDFTKEDMYRDRPYVAGFPHMRFYAEVPLKSPSGYVLGSYCVVDNKPRAGLDDGGFLTLTEIASTIMRHLDLVKLKEEHARADGLLQGLNYFVQGKNSLHQGSLDHPTVERANDLRGLIREDWINAEVETPWQIRDRKPGPVARGNFSFPPEVDRRGVSSIITSTSEHDASVRTLTTRPVTPLLSECQPAKCLFESSQSKKEEEDVGTRLRELAISDDIRENFSRASTLLRQAMDLDGVVFLDASSSKFGSHSAVNEPQHSSVPSADMPQSPSGAESQESTVDVQIVGAESNDRTGEAGNAQSKRDTVFKSDPDSTMSGRLGFSTQQKSSLTGNSMAYERFSLPEDVHHSLLNRYPRGHVFNFDGSGHVPSSGEEALVSPPQDRYDSSYPKKAPQSPKRVLKRCVEEAAIRRCFPGVRSLIFVPLWNPHKDGWFAGSLGWTTEEKRVLQSREFTYFSAFGNSIMAEVTRLELLATDRAKSDFISSASHELRSPLHGILGSAELLREVSTLPIQYEMIDMIENCGRTLLETMDHVLDFAKINNITQSKRSRKHNVKSSRASRNSGVSESKSSFDLSALIEELVEGVLAGYRFNHRSLGLLSGSNNAGSQSYACLIQEPSSLHTGDVNRKPLSVILSIDERSTWHIRSESGAWRRILVNLLGNALKYTTSGFVEVALQYAETIRTNSHSKMQTMVTVTVRDTGCGIGKDYLEHHLYTPFAQENTLAAGTGLGLSIVNQITDSLHGSIDIQSEVGSGTEVVVSIPIDFAASPTTGGILPRHDNLTLCLLAFDVNPESSTTSRGIVSESSKLATAMKTALTIEAEQWFGLRVFSAQDASSIDANIIAVTEDRLDILQVDDGAGGRTLQLPPNSSLIILCSDVLADNPSKWKGSGRVECLTQPFGPRKMAKALAACLQHHHHDDSTKPVELPLRPVPRDVQSDETFSPTEILDFDRLLDKPPEVHLPASSVLSRVSDEKADHLAPMVSILELPRRPHLLLVDDNAINLKMLVTHARKIKCEYATAVNGLHALEIYRETTRPFDYVLMDVSMPVMDGFTATREIRAYEKANNLAAATVVALTGLGSAKAQREAFASGVNLFLTKPVPLKKLKALIEDDAVMDDP